MQELLSQWLELKAAERSAKEAREEVEVKLYMELKDQMNDESQATWNFDGYKLVIKPNYTVSVDQEQAAQNPELFKVKYEMTYSQYKKIDDKFLVDNIITIKQTKPTFSVEMK
jgi:hypothetical protein